MNFQAHCERVAHTLQQIYYGLLSQLALSLLLVLSGSCIVLFHFLFLTIFIFFFLISYQILRSTEWCSPGVH